MVDMASMTTEERDQYLDALPIQTIVSYLAPLAIGICAELLLTGILSVQSWYYFVFYGSTDRLATRSLVGVLWAMSTIQAAVDTAFFFHVFVLGFGRYSSFTRYSLFFAYTYAYTSVVQGFCQAFFLWRCYSLVRSRVVLVIGMFGIVTSVAAGWATTVQIVVTGVPKFLVAPLVYLSASALTDSFLASILIFHLSNLRTECKDKTGKSVTKIMRLAFETTAVTTALAVGYLIACPVANNKNGVILAFQYTIGKAYVISVLVTLLARPTSRPTDCICVERGRANEQMMIDSGMPQFRVITSVIADSESYHSHDADSTVGSHNSVSSNHEQSYLTARRESQNPASAPESELKDLKL